LDASYMIAVLIMTADRSVRHSEPQITSGSQSTIEMPAKQEAMIEAPIK